jgi:hypothetical protein
MSTPRSVRFPQALAEAFEIRAKLLGYKSGADYMKGLLRYDLVVQGDHHLTLPWSRLPLAEQDAIDEHLLKLTRQGKGERGQLLERILERVKELEKVADGLKKVE